MRDTAIGGLAALLHRQEWRSSDRGVTISAAVAAALHDVNPVVRLRAAEGVLPLHAEQDAAQKASAIGELVLAEQDKAVRSFLLRALARTTADAPTVVDNLLSRLFEDPDLLAAEDDSRSDPAADILAYLAVEAETPFASATVERWCEQAPTDHAQVRRFVRCVRHFLGPSGGPGGTRAYALLQTAAEACLARLKLDPAEVARPRSELTDDQVAEIQAAARVCDDIADQVYFGSGAYDGTKNQSSSTTTSDADLADLALPLLSLCASTRVPQCVHRAVETMLYFAPVDERRVLLAITTAVLAVDSSYAADPLAGDVVVTYLQRLLAEQRPLVLVEPDGSEAFRNLLATFAAAGHQGALAMAYTFSDLFR